MRDHWVEKQEGIKNNSWQKYYNFIIPYQNPLHVYTRFMELLGNTWSLFSKFYNPKKVKKGTPK